MMVDVSFSRRDADFHGQDPAGLGVGVAVAGHAVAFVLAYLAASWGLPRAGGPDANLDAGDRLGANVIWMATFGAAEAVLLGLYLAIGASAPVRDRTRFFSGVLGGWMVGLVLFGACGAAQVVLG